MTGAARQPVGVIRSEPSARTQLLAAFAEVHALALAEGIPVASDLLDRMLTGVDRQTGEQLDDDNIVAQCVTFLVAGHETTSGLLSFAL